MHRSSILAILDTYEGIYPVESDMVQRIRSLVQAHSDCFERTCLPGHITGSAWIVSPDRKRYLLTHHRKLNRWLQTGGHADGESTPHNVALREAREESGMDNFRIVEPKGHRIPLDVDVHDIPARKSEPKHEHHDLRYLLVAAVGQEITVSNESHDVRWFTAEDLLTMIQEPGILRMLRKSEELLSREFELL